MGLNNAATKFVSCYPRVDLGHFPTPLESMPNLGADLSIKNLWVKREDCTGLAFGGNKVRPLEFYMGAATAQNADTVMITGAVQSNFVRSAAAAAAKLGLDCHVQLEDRVSDTDQIYQRSGNVLLDRIFGATFHRFPEGEDEGAADHQVRKLAADLAAIGRRPFVIPLSADHPPLGALGYVLCAGEILAQAERDGIKFDHVVVASGSGLTHGGLLVGFRALGRSDIKVHAMCVRRNAESQRQRMRQRTAMIAFLIDQQGVVSDADLLVNDQCFPPSYGKLNAATETAIAAFARREGLLLDPVYSGKVAAGMMAMATNGDFIHAEGVIFIHTGGQPALFAYEPELTAAYSTADNVTQK